MSETRTPSGKKSKKHVSKLAEPSKVLEQVLMNNKSPLADQFMRWKLWRKWPEVVGPTIAAQSMPVGYVNGMLYVWVKNSVWMQEMVFLAGPLREKVNTFAERNWVQQVRFTLNQHEVPQLAEDSGLQDKISEI